MPTILRDLKLALRVSIGEPRFAVVAATTLALGIGANTIIFGAVNAVVLKPVHYADPKQAGIHLVDLDFARGANYLPPRRRIGRRCPDWLAQRPRLY
jgi:hypothetical protein